jgi:hypothetical protein
MKAYLASLVAGQAGQLKPFDDMKAELTRLALEGRQGIGRGTAELDARIGQGRNEAFAAAQSRDQMLAQLAQQFAERENQRRAAQGADFRAQGFSDVAIGGMGAGIGGASELANRQQALSASLNAGLGQQYADRSQSALAAGRGAEATLGSNEIAASLAIARQRAEKEAALQEQLNQLKLQMAQGGITV